MNDISGSSGGTQAAAGGTQVLAAELLAAVGAIRRIARRAARLAWPDEPLPAAQSELLRLAAARPGLSVADAARELRLAPNTVSTLVGRLTAAGLLDRSRAVADGRSVRLSVTGKGAQRIAGWRDLRTELAARALDQLSAGDRQAIAAALPALLRFAAQLDEEYGGGAAAEPDADGGTACLANIARTGAPHGAAPPHSVTIQVPPFMYKSRGARHAVCFVMSQPETPPVPARLRPQATESVAAWAGLKLAGDPCRERGADACPSSRIPTCCRLAATAPATAS